MECESQTDQAYIFLDHSNVNSFPELIKDQRNVRMHIDDYSQYKSQFIASVLSKQTQMEQYRLFIDSHSVGCADTKAILKAISCLPKLSELDLQLLNVRDDSEMTEILKICQSLSLTLKKLRFLFQHIEINQKGCEDLKIALSLLQNVNKLCIDVSTLKECKPFISFLHSIIPFNIFSLTQIKKLIKHSKFKYDQNLGQIKVKSIGEGLSLLNNLESLELSIAGTNIGQQGGEILEQNLRKTLQQNLNLKKLKINVHSNRLDDNSFERIVRSITEPAQSLQSLQLNFSINNLTNLGLSQIGKHLSVYQHLRVLELDLLRNQFCKEGLYHFFYNLKISSLERLKLSVSQANFDMKVVQQVKNLIECHPQLVDIDFQLSNSLMDQPSQIYLAKTILEFSFQLKQFNIQGIHLNYWSQVLRPCIHQCLNSINDLANAGLFFSFLCSPEMQYNPNFIFCDLHF